MLLKKSDIIELADSKLEFSTKTASALLEEARFVSLFDIDIFLCHSFIDQKLVLGTKTYLESLDLRVYVDWIDDQQLSRNSVTSSTANLLRRRMKQSKALVFLCTESSKSSKWCPWELGYFDGFRDGNVFILPLVDGLEITFNGQEYLGLYPYLSDTLFRDDMVIKGGDGEYFLRGALDNPVKLKT